MSDTNLSNAIIALICRCFEAEAFRISETSGDTLADYKKLYSEFREMVKINFPMIDFQKDIVPGISSYILSRIIEDVEDANGFA